jgi:hypothetical protein
VTEIAFWYGVATPLNFRPAVLEKSVYEKLASAGDATPTAASRIEAEMLRELNMEKISQAKSD